MYTADTDLYDSGRLSITQMHKISESCTVGSQRLVPAEPLEKYFLRKIDFFQERLGAAAAELSELRQNPICIIGVLNHHLAPNYPKY